MFQEYLWKHTYHDDDCDLDNRVDYEGGNDNDNDGQYMNARNDNDNDDQYMNAKNDHDNNDQCINKILDLVGSDDRFLQTWQNLFVTQRKIKDEPSGVVSTVTSSRRNSIIVVKMNDAMRLKPNTWPNDTIIDAFALLISN